MKSGQQYGQQYGQAIVYGALGQYGVSLANWLIAEYGVLVVYSSYSAVRGSIVNLHDIHVCLLPRRLSLASVLTSRIAGRRRQLHQRHLQPRLLRQRQLYSSQLIKDSGERERERAQHDCSKTIHRARRHKGGLPSQ